MPGLGPGPLADLPMEGRKKERGAPTCFAVKPASKRAKRASEQERECSQKDLSSPGCVEEESVAFWLTSTRRFFMGGALEGGPVGLLLRAADLPGGRPFERGKA